MQISFKWLEALGQTFSNAQINLKLLNNLPKIWEPKTKIITEAQDLKKLMWDELSGILRVHKVHLQDRDQIKVATSSDWCLKLK